MKPELDARPFIERKVVHSSVTEEQISKLVDDFYGLIRKDAQLAPIFAQHINGEEWSPHLNKMKAFWRSVLLKTGEYKGQPVPVHFKINGLEISHFNHWLELFAQAAYSIFEDEAALLIIQTAQRIASSLWLSRTKDPFATPPHWTPIRRQNS